MHVSVGQEHLLFVYLFTFFFFKRMLAALSWSQFFIRLEAISRAALTNDMSGSVEEVRCLDTWRRACRRKKSDDDDDGIVSCRVLTDE